MNRDALLAIHARAVIGHHREDRVRPERLLFCRVEELPESIVRIFDRMRSFLLVRVFGDFPFRVGVGFMIGDREDGGEERLIAFRQVAKFLESAQEQVFIAYAPGR